MKDLKRFIEEEDGMGTVEVILIIVDIFLINILCIVP